MGYGGVFEGLEVFCGALHGGVEGGPACRAVGFGAGAYGFEGMADGVFELIQIVLQALDVDEAAVVGASQFYFFSFACGY